MRLATSRQIVQMARDAGAVKVIFVSASPECMHPHIVSVIKLFCLIMMLTILKYGIDLADPIGRNSCDPSLKLLLLTI